jgi:hypothetical protein
MGLIDALLGLIIAFVLVYVGAVILWSINPILSVLFGIIAIYVIVRSVGRGGGEDA